MCWLRLRVPFLERKEVISQRAVRVLRQTLAHLALPPLRRLAAAVADLSSDSTGLRLWN